MTSIANSSVSSLFANRPPPPPSGKDRVSNAIEQGVSSGSISSTDATALSTALDSIDTSLASSSTSASSGTSSRLDPKAAKEKIDGLIADQVTSGSLTSEQADTLKSLFAAGGSGGPKGAGGAGGPPPDPPPSDESTSDGSTSTSSTGTSSNASDLLADFIKQIQSSLTSQSSYSASGSPNTSYASSSLVLDFDA